MISIKLRAAEVKLLRGAQTEAELRGVVDLVLSKVAIHEQEAEFARLGRQAEKTAAAKFTAPQAVALLKEILGPDATSPPFPEKHYFINIARQMKVWGMDEAYVTALAMKVKETLKPPYQISWIFHNHERIMAGAVFGQARGQVWRSSDRPNEGRPRGKAWHGGTLDTPLGG